MSTDKKNMRVLAIGPRELVSGLAAFGVEVRHATGKDEMMQAVKDVRTNQAQNAYAIIFITESIVSQMNETEYAEVMGSDLPVVLTIPDLTSDADAGLAKLSTLAKRAVGVDIFSK